MVGPQPRQGLKMKGKESRTQVVPVDGQSRRRSHRQTFLAVAQGSLGYDQVATKLETQKRLETLPKSHNGGCGISSPGHSRLMASVTNGETETDGSGVPQKSHSQKGQRG